MILVLFAAAYFARAELKISADSEKTQIGVYVLGKKISSSKKVEKKDGEVKTEKKGTTKRSLTERVDGVRVLISPFVNAAKGVKKRLVITDLKLEISVATDDAAKTAILFGGVSAVAGTLYGILKNNFKIKNERINIFPDFAKTSPTFHFYCIFRMRFIDFIVIGTKLFFDYTKSKRAHKKKD